MLRLGPPEWGPIGWSTEAGFQVASGPLAAPSQGSPSGPALPERGYRVMGDYLLLERIAAGGMGEVWLSKRKNLDGTFGELRALKFLHAKHAKNPEVVSMFVEEARLASRLEHASVARLYELGRDEDTYYIAMEHLFGRDLLAVLRRARDREITIPAPLVAMVGQRVAEALDAARHALGDDGAPLDIVHRDVSPQNIVLGFDGRVKLIDFGIARAEGAAQGTKLDDGKKVHGKLGYVSPEQAQGKKVDHRSDQFSLGICLWELLVLRPLFRRQSDSATLDDVIRARVPPVRSKVPNCPAELAAIIEKMLAKDPDARFPEAADVAAALSSFQTRSPEKAERQDLVAFVRKLEGEDYARDRMRLDALELVGQAITPKSGDITPPRGVPAVLAQSIASSSLFDDDDNPHEQQTTIFPDAGPLAMRVEREVFFRRDSVPSRTSDPSGSSPRGPVHATFRPGRAQASEVWRPPASDLIESVAAFEDPALAEERDEASFEAEGPFAGRALDASPTTVPPPESLHGVLPKRPSERPPASPEELPTRTELEQISRDLDSVTHELTHGAQRESGERLAARSREAGERTPERVSLPPPSRLPRMSPVPPPPGLRRASIPTPPIAPDGSARSTPVPRNSPVPPRTSPTPPRGTSPLPREPSQPVTTATRKLASMPPLEEPAPSRPWVPLVVGAVALALIGIVTYWAWIEMGLSDP